ncbi:MAG: hypothetical protein ABIC95_04880 [archaeon]
MEKILALRRQRQSTPRKNRPNIPSQAQKDRATGLLSEILARTQPRRAMLETRKTNTQQQTTQNPPCSNLPPQKNIQRTKKFTQDVPIFKRLAIIHAKKGETDKFPLHLLWIADRGTGKTTCLEAIVHKFGEKIIDGSTSTLKYLIPSFKERNNPEMGALAVAVFIVGLDEFLRMFFKGKNDERNIDAARMNILLEHKERAAGSGHGATIVKMTARLIATTNPIAGTNNIYNLLDKVDDSFLSRMLIYYQLPEQLEFINEGELRRVSLLSTAPRRVLSLSS